MEQQKEKSLAYVDHYGFLAHVSQAESGINRTPIELYGASNSVDTRP